MGNRLTLKEQIKKNERTIKRAIRDIDKERTQMEREQKKLEIEIKVRGVVYFSPPCAP